MKASSLFELTLRAPQALVETVSDALGDELGALSVSVEDADAGNEAERPLFGEPDMPPPAAGWQRSTLRALFDTEQQAEGAATWLLAQDWTAGLHLESMEVLADQDWVRLTQSQFTPVEITPTFWVVPSWHEAPAAARQIIRLDPGLAFGTGTHPTTRMCLRWLATQPAAVAGARVLDYGCGSGILAIGAALMGAGAIDAVDIDPVAVQSTRDNAAHNGVHNGAQNSVQTGGDNGADIGVHSGMDNGVQNGKDNSARLQAGLPDRAQGVYALVLANILATPLKLLAPLLCGHVQAGGQLLLAGILARQAQELQAAYAPWLALQVLDSEDGWILMGAKLPPA